MPLADKLAIVNLALDHLGEPYITNYASDTTVAGVAARLHFDQVVETVLEGHHWSFATRTTTPVAAIPAPLPSLPIVLAGTVPDSVKGAMIPGTAGADPGLYGISKILSDDGSVLNVDALASPVIAGATWTRVAYYVGSTDAYFVFYISEGTLHGYASFDAYPGDSTIFDVTTWVPIGSETGVPVFLNSEVYAPDFGSAFTLPANCLRLLRVNGFDPYAGSGDFDIQGRFLLFRGTGREAPDIRYIIKDPPIPEWPTTFTEAVSYLLASKMALKLTQDQGVKDSLFAQHEGALGKARSKDSRETRSAENHGPRHLAARSSLVAARFGRFGASVRIWADPPN